MSKKYSDYNENKRKELPEETGGANQCSLSPVGKELLNATSQLSEQLKINSQQPLNFSSVLGLATQVLNDKTVEFMNSSSSQLGIHNPGTAISNFNFSAINGWEYNNGLEQTPSRKPSDWIWINDNSHLSGILGDTDDTCSDESDC